MATRGAVAIVVGTYVANRLGSDTIDVQWSGADGQSRNGTFQVAYASDYLVGMQIPIRVSIDDSGKALPERRSTAMWPVLGQRAFVALAIGTMVVSALLLAGRAVPWWRAAKAPAVRCRARLWHGVRVVPGFGSSPWLFIVDGGRTWAQRVYWEPWLDGLGQSIEVEARRAGRGPFVIDVPGYGRLWPAGRARTRGPRQNQELMGKGPVKRRSRFATVVGGLLLSGVASWLWVGTGPAPVVPGWLVVPLVAAVASLWFVYAGDVPSLVLWGKR